MAYLPNKSLRGHLYDMDNGTGVTLPSYALFSPCIFVCVRVSVRGFIRVCTVACEFFFSACVSLCL